MRKKSAHSKATRSAAALVKRGDTAPRITPGAIEEFTVSEATKGKQDAEIVMMSAEVTASGATIWPGPAGSSPGRQPGPRSSA